MSKQLENTVPLKQPDFLPMSRKEMDRLGWDELDVLLVSGDAYVDHPSFGAAILGRWLVAHGYRAGIVAQPRWTTPQDLLCMGRPRLFAGVTAGAMDSMLAHYTAFRKKRHDDAYTPGGKAGGRPNRACVVYANLARQAFPKLPVVLGGIEASLRRLSHYDFWTDKIRRSILLDAKADMILYGMAERGILALAKCGMGILPMCGTGVPPVSESEKQQQQQEHQQQDRAGTALEHMGKMPMPHEDTGKMPVPHAVPHFEGIPGAAYIGQESDLPPGANVIHLPSHEEILADGKKLMEATLAMEQHVHQAAAFAVQQVEGRSLILTPPAPLTTEELDELYALPFARRPHPSYTQPVPAADMIAWSITTHRGCGGGCSFCTLAGHQGRRIHSRSASSIVREAESFAAHKSFTGSVSDVGGPSANMWGGRCTGDAGRCRRASCLFPGICPHFEVDQMRIVELLRQVQSAKGVRNVRVASGIRHDLALKDLPYLRAIVREFVGGQLKVAPEHLAEHVLALMRKPGPEVFERFLEIFDQECAAAGKPQFVIPYLISAFPGCTMSDMHQLARWLSRRGWQPQQVQCFIPLPGTVAAAMYYAGIDPDGKPIPIARTDAQRMKMHYALVKPGT